MLNERIIIGVKRLDVIVAEKYGVPRSYAGEAVSNGLVSVNGKTVNKPGAKYGGDDAVSLDDTQTRYVSRGGRKLEAALDRFGLSVTGLVCGDIGASTGGFTDCMLKRGAARVYAVDNGTGQLAPSLAADKRVVSMEGINARELFALPEPLDFIAADVSFISLGLIAANLRVLLKNGGNAVILVKPQFEAGAAALDKRGVVRDKSAREKAVGSVAEFYGKNGFIIKGVIESPITGGDGNVEYLAHMVRE